MEANAVVITPFREVKPIIVDFTDSYNVSEMIGASEVEALLTQTLLRYSETLGVHLGGYYSKDLQLKDIEEKPLASEVVGSDILKGDVMICGTDRNMALRPLRSDIAEIVRKVVVEAYDL